MEKCIKRMWNYKKPLLYDGKMYKEDKDVKLQKTIIVW